MGLEAAVVKLMHALGRFADDAAARAEYLLVPTSPASAATAAEAAAAASRERRRAPRLASSLD